MLNEAIGYFTHEKKLMACMSVACGDARHETHASGGVIDMGGTPVGADSIFDIASLTKLMTALTVMRLYEDGVIDLRAPVTRYAPQFVHLQDVTVDQLLGFEVLLTTQQRVDTQPDREAGLQQLFDIRASEHASGRFYSDMHAMVLGHAVEGATGMRLEDAMRKLIFDPLGMHETRAHVPEDMRCRCVSCDREHRIERGRWMLREGIAPGTPHDPKARLLSPEGEALCGHAGLFSTRGDLVKLCQGMLSGSVVSPESLAMMAKNRMGRSLPDGGHTQYLGSQCYVKHPNQYFSEIPLYMSDRAIGLSGFTGHHLSVDPETGVFVVCLGSRVMNRLTVLIPEEGKTRRDYGLNDDGSGQILWTDGELIDSSVDYVHHKDAQLHRRIAALLDLPVWRKAGSEWP